MNYAEDRLDRRHRHPDGTDSLYKDYCGGLASGNHELVGRTLRDIGWNRHALYHYAQAWCENPSCPKAAGDYCQGAELTGFPEVGLLGLIVYRIRGRLETDEPIKANTSVIDHEWLQQSEPALGLDCGCGASSCGASVCHIPMMASILNDVFESLEEYGRTLLERTTISTSNQVLKRLVRNETISWEDSWRIPGMLQFWKNDDPQFRTLPIVLQLLQIKLAYLTVPVLAADAAVHATFGDNDDFTTNAAESELVAAYKSHFAFYVFIKAVVLGERVKDNRRRLYLPVWDALRNTLLECQEATRTTAGSAGLLDEFVSQLRHLCKQPGHDDDSLPPLIWTFPHLSKMAVRPLYYVGDSHVLSLAWQMIPIPSLPSSLSSSSPTPSIQRRIVVPVIATGLKAWHVKSTTRFFTHTNLWAVLRRMGGRSHESAAVTATRTIVVSAGEIDCREGIGGALLQGYKDSCRVHIQRTVLEYVQGLQALAEEFSCQMLVVPVAPHARRKKNKGRMMGLASRRETMHAWNAELRAALPVRGLVYFLDYEAALVDDSMEYGKDYVLKPALNADGTHMNAGFASALAQAIASCGCDLHLL